LVAVSFCLLVKAKQFVGMTGFCTSQLIGREEIVCELTCAWAALLYPTFRGKGDRGI